MNFAFSPDAKRHAHAESMGSETRQDSWKWNVAQAQGYVEDPERIHEDSVVDSGVNFLNIFRLIGMRQFPRYVQPQTACGWFDL